MCVAVCCHQLYLTICALRTATVAVCCSVLHVCCSVLSSALYNHLCVAHCNSCSVQMHRSHCNMLQCATRRLLHCCSAQHTLFVAHCNNATICNTTLTHRNTLQPNVYCNIYCNNLQGNSHTLQQSATQLTHTATSCKATHTYCNNLHGNAYTPQQSAWQRKHAATICNTTHMHFNNLQGNSQTLQQSTTLS